MFTKKPTPLFNSCDFEQIFHAQKGPLLDASGLLRPLETILLPGAPIEVSSEIEVKTSAYLSDKPLFSPCTALTDKPISTFLPEPEEIIYRMKQLEGVAYIWGGNYHQGLPEMLDLFPPQKKLSDLEKRSWIFKGVDCSGLLYEATEGYTPRNTSQLITFGKEVKNPQPLDLIVWPGHVVVVIDHGQTIESNHEWGGVTICKLEKRLSEIKDPFTVRRWHPSIAFQKF